MLTDVSIEQTEIEIQDEIDSEQKIKAQLAKVLNAAIF